MISRNKLSVINNPYQGTPQRVLCVCSGGVLRSPTAAWVLGNAPFNFNTRACGTEEYALIPLTEELVVWADEIVVMDEWHQRQVMSLLAEHTATDTTWPLVHNLQVEDNYDFKNPELIVILTQKFNEIFGEKADVQ